MKLTVFFLLAAALQVSGNVTAQKVTWSAKSAPLQKVFSEIRKQTGFAFFYDEEDLKNTPPVTIELKEVELKKALELILKDQPLNFEMYGNTVFVTRKPVRAPDEATVPEDAVAGAVPPINIRGRIVNENGEPVVASIAIKGSTQGTTSNVDGYFELNNVDENATLSVSSISMEPVELKVNGQTNFTIRLKTKASDLSDVVVVSYGTQNKREVTGAISTVDATQLEDLPVGQIAQKIQGRMPGVQISQGSGNPGAGMAVRIRGTASLNAGNTPLYVIDGLPITGDLSNINPNEIESFSVLKGASAAALYGSRASSGVVLITTKKGKQGRTNIELYGSRGFAAVPQRGRTELMSGEELATFMKQRYEDRAIYEGYAGGVPVEYQDPSKYRGKDTDWYDVILRKSAPVSNFNLTLSTGKDNFTSATTFGYYDEDGSLLNTYYKRYSLRSNNEFKVNENIKVGLNIAPSLRISQNGSGHGAVAAGSGLVNGPLGAPGNFVTDGSYSLIFAVLTTPPWFSPDDKGPDGQRAVRFASPGMYTQPNWYRTFTETEDVVRSTNVLANAYIQWDFFKNFSFKSGFSAEVVDARRKEFKPSTVGTIFTAPPLPATAAYTTNFSYSWLAENTLTYNKNFGEHHIDVLAGYSAQKFRSEFNQLTGNTFPDDAVSWIDAATIKGGASNSSEWSLASVFGRVNYNYNGKYLLSMSLRRDGSSRFGTGSKWGTFPSISAGWIISDENFMKDMSALSFLKLRAEYGKLGNFNIGNYYQYGNVIARNYIFSNAPTQGRGPSTIQNDKLTWETTTGSNVGLDVGLFNNRISLSLDYYRNTTTDMLYQVDIPASSGYLAIQDNIGEFLLWGYEMGVSTQNFVGAFKWKTEFNISFNRNKVIQLGTNNAPFDGITELGGTGYWRTAVGQPIGQFWGYIFDGIYMTQEEFDTQPKHFSSDVGTTRYKDLDKNGVIDQNDRTFTGNPNPDFIFGLSNTFAFKNFDLGIMISGAVGGQMYTSQREWSETLSGNFNLQKDIAYRWRSLDNPGKGIYQRTKSGTTSLPRYNNSRWVEDADYLTLKNITLGYTLPKLGRYIQRARIFATIQQVFVLTNYSGNNPEATMNGLNGIRQGLDTSSYPVPRTYSFGLNMNL